MVIIKKELHVSWITACIAASLFAVSSQSGAQEPAKKEKAEASDKAGKASGAKSDKSGSDTVTAHLSGDKQVPPVQTNATGKSTIKVDENKSVSGKVTVENMTATAAHIHQGAPDKDGPVVIPLEKSSDNTFSVPANTKMTDAQFAAFKEGNLYINVHSKKYPSGEIRVQMKP
ncbi:MAG: CHRD domain-containing protein [Burkholderiaceae bacterium]